jgi:hypothetical protein
MGIRLRCGLSCLIGRELGVRVSTPRVGNMVMLFPDSTQLYILFLSFMPIPTQSIHGTSNIEFINELQAFVLKTTCDAEIGAEITTETTVCLVSLKYIPIFRLYVLLIL